MSKKLMTAFLNKSVTMGRLDVTFADEETASFGELRPDYPDIAIRLTDHKVPRDIILDPRLGAAEAFMAGRMKVDRGDIMGLVQLLRANAPWDRGGALGRPSTIRRLRNRLGFAAESLNGAGAAKRNAAHHYDIGNDLYRLMLDQQHMQYSCAYWPSDNMTLDEAQTAKLAHIASKLALSPGQEVLDIGCGWGGMAIYLAAHANVYVHGITLSEEQLELAKLRAAQAGVKDLVTFELADYRALPRRGKKYDRIVSVGMFEHVGRPQFDIFFRSCANLLKADGVMLLHTIGRMGGPGVTDAFTRKYIFPGGYIPALSETLAASEKYRLIASDIETLRLHYAKTLREWYARCQQNRDRIIQMYDERFLRMWLFYLAGATAAFEGGGMCNYQVQFCRSRHALPLTRDYMAQAERALLKGAGRAPPGAEN